MKKREVPPITTSKNDPSTNNKKTLEWKDPELRKRRCREFEEAERRLQERAWRRGMSEEEYNRRLNELYDDPINQDFYRHLALKGIQCQ